MSSSCATDSPDAKKPCKGILKTSSSFDKHHHHNPAHRKSAKFDELNVLQTYHPPDKDYGHMKIDEPKTPYNYRDPALNDSDQLDADALAEKLKVAAAGSGVEEDAVDGASRKYYQESDDESEEEETVPETEEEKVHRVDFEKRRKAHYKEFEAVKLARKLIEEEDEEEDDGDQDEDLDSSKIIVVETTDVVIPPKLPEDDDGELPTMDSSPTTTTTVDGNPSTSA